MPGKESSSSLSLLGLVDVDLLLVLVGNEDAAAAPGVLTGVPAKSVITSEQSES
jgi:hypothetical protein